MKKITALLVLLITVLGITSCGHNIMVVHQHPPIEAPKSNKSWTVLVYMLGGQEESDTGIFSKKIEEIMSVSCPSNVHVVISAGGSNIWHINGIYGDYMQYFEGVGKDRLYLANQKQATNSADDDALSDFVTWGIEQYKADNYMLILSGTGGGSMYGIGSDERYENDCLTMEEISYALSSAQEKFEVVGLDASLMGSLETATALSTYTDYLVAPQDVLGLDEWDYVGFLNYICQNPDARGDAVGKEICNGYYGKMKEMGRDKNASMSVIDISETTTLNQAFDGMAGEMLMATESLEELKNLLKAQSKIQVYGGASEDEGYTDIVDLGDMAVKCSQYAPTTADLMIEALNDSIVYSVRGSAHEGATGLGVFYPLDLDSEKLQKYMDMSHGSKYKEFLRKICIKSEVYDSVTNTPDCRSSWAWVTYDNDMSWLSYVSVLDGNTYGLNITGNMDLFRSVGVNVYKRDKSGQYIYIGRYDDVDGDWDSGSFRLNFNAPLKTFLSKPAAMSLIRSYDNCDIYSIRALVNGEESSVRVKYSGGDYKIIGYRKVLDENGQLYDRFHRLGIFDNVLPMSKLYNEHQETEYVAGKKQLKLWRGAGEDVIPDGEYMLEYVMTDIYGYDRYGTSVDATVSGGNVTLKNHQ